MTQPADEPQPHPPKSATGVRRIVYVSLGFFFVTLAVVGVVTPLLPTTPFLLLAAYFFARSSARLHAWLLRSRVFGGLIRDWQVHRGVRLRVKIVALTLLPLVVTSSAYFGQLPWYLVVMLVVLALIGAAVVVSLKTVRDAPRSPAVATVPIDTNAAAAPDASVR